MPKLLKVLATPAIGLATMVAGFVYDIMLAGIPYQDPGPEAFANWQFHSNVAFGIIATGTVILCIGLFLIPFLAKSKSKSADN